MKAITIREPWAGMIARKEKTIETRKKPTKYRGKLLLTASKKPAGKYSGTAFAVFNLTWCLPMSKEDEKKACCELYSAYSYFLEDIRLIEPFPIKGQLGIFETGIEEKDLIFLKQ